MDLQKEDNEYKKRQIIEKRQPLLEILEIIAWDMGILKNPKQNTASKIEALRRIEDNFNRLWDKMSNETRETDKNP